MKHLTAMILVGGLLFTFASTDIYAKIYKYVDERGTIVFVDDETKIPEQYSPKTTTLKEAIDEMSPDERKAYERRKSAAEATRVEKEFRENRRKTAQAEKAGKQTKIEFVDNQIIVPVKVRHGRNTANLKLKLDTGATQTMIYYTSLERFRFRRAELGLSQVAGGYLVLNVTVKFYKVEIGPYVMKRMPIIIMDNVSPNSTYDGLLGMDFLSAHSHVVDLENSVIKWYE